MTGPDGHTLLAEDRGQVVRVHVLEPERHRSPAKIWIHWPEDPGPRLAETFQGVRRQFALVLAHIFHPQVLEVIHRGPQPDRLSNRRSPRFELPRGLLIGGAVREHLLDHFSPTEEGVHLLEKLPAAIETARGGRAEHLVAGESEEVDVQL